MGKTPCFQYYPADMLSSPCVAIMTTEQFGAYMLLLSYAWLDEFCSVPDDDAELAVLTRMGEGWFKGASQVVRRCFEPHPQMPGRLVNVRLVEERVKQMEWREKSAAGGRKSGESRRNKALKLLNGGETTLEAPLNHPSKGGSTKSEHSVFSLQSSDVTEEERGESESGDVSANAENPSGKKASAKTSAAAAVRDPLSGDGNKVARWLAKLCCGAATPESRARFTKEQVLAIKTEAKRLRDTCDVDRLPEWKEWFDKSWHGKRLAAEGSYPKLGYVRETWSKAFPDADPDAPAEEEPPVEGTLV